MIYWLIAPNITIYKRTMKDNYSKAGDSFRFVISFTLSEIVEAVFMMHLSSHATFAWIPDRPSSLVLDVFSSF